ncbi:MAG: extracellular beta-gluosidase-related glycosidase [Bacteroidetes bacterium HLUCCA01]|nr:MAG: extracellular beta-gluosidase-related glycosidase [Bacteroidetes bacterium HLUCCA01]
MNIMKIGLLTAGILCASLYPAADTHAQTLEEKIGQMLMVAVTNFGQPKDTLLIDIADRNLGGVLFFQNNITSPEQITALTAELQDFADTPLFLSVDQEGGRVARLNANNGYSSTLPANFTGDVLKDVEATRGQAEIMARWIDEAGLNVNLAPVVDVNINSDSPAIGRLERSYSPNETVVADHAIAFMQEHAARDIITATKHFPGHGSAMSDSHFGFTDITSTWQERELTPYELIFDEFMPDMIMTGHLFHRNIDADYPASLSHKAVTEMLRDEMGYTGVVISDELFMQAITDNYSFDEALVLAVNSGTDILLFNRNLCTSHCGSDDPISLVRYAIDLIASRVDSGEIPAARIDASYARIMDLKNRRIPTSIDGGQTVPVTVALAQNFPNPFNPTTTIRWEMPEAGPVQLSVYNTMGQQVAELADEQLQAGVHQRVFNASGLASGIYVYRLTANGVTLSRTMTLVK